MTRGMCFDLGFDLELDDAATPLTPGELDGLIPTHITLRRELNELEQQKHRRGGSLGLFPKARCRLGAVPSGASSSNVQSSLRWAEQYRASERNLGVASYRNDSDLRQLIEDTRYWIAHSSFPLDELAVRFHHRLVSIHPFANGNGRWSRLAGDLLAVQRGAPRFAWGRANLQNIGAVRRDYIDALRAADKHDLGPLIDFVRS